MEIKCNVRMWPSSANAMPTFFEQNPQEYNESAATQVVEVLKPLTTIYTQKIARRLILTVATACS